MKQSKKMAFGAVFVALTTLLLCGGVLLESLDASLAAFASLLVGIALVEFGRGFAFLLWAAASVLSLLLFPLNSASWLFLVFLGWYPIGKKRAERCPKVPAYLVKLFSFNLGAVIYWWIFTKVLGLPWEETGLLLVGLWLGANAVFVLFDMVLTRMITLYVLSWRKRLGFGR